MAIFQPRVFPEIMGEMITRLLSFTPLTDVNFGSVWTTMLEAAAQEDDEQYFQMLEIIRGFSLDTTTGEDLDNRAEEYGLERLDPQNASTIVTISDTAVTKVVTGVYSGVAGPAAGTFAINGDSATGFPTSGSIVIGRNTTNVETVPYTSITVLPNFVTFNLGAALGFDHGTDETIILANGGDRIIPAGSVVYVPSSDISARIDFTTDAIATILDGDRSIENVQVTASDAGSDSNVPIGSIQKFDSLPFPTATVTNPQRVTNGTDEETDQELRDRIKDTIQSLSRGTGRSIITGVLGLVSTEQNRRVVSASLIEPTIPADVVKLFIDDGTGFIPTFESVGFEEVVTSATGGEKFLNISNVPVLKAFIETQNSEPYALVGGESLLVDVGGFVETIVFAGTDFQAPGSATAQEVLTRINSSATLYEARISSGGTKFRIFARANSEEEIQVTGGSANTALNFQTDKKFTTKLYQERNFTLALLSKDGRTATIESGNTEGYDLSSIIQNLQVVVDGKIKNPLNIFFSPADFGAPSNVSAEAVRDVINTQLPGATCQVSSNDTKLRLISNTERSITSQIRIIGTYDLVWNEEGATPFVDRTTEAEDASTFTVFGADLDFIYLGHTDVPYNVISLIFSTVASAAVGAKYEQWDGSTWVEVGVVDKTTDWQADGCITLGPNPNWVKTSVNGSTAMYFTRVQRNNAAAITAPILEKVIVSSANRAFGFSEVEVFGANKDYTLNRFLGQIELESPLIANDRMTLGSLDTRASVTTTVNGNYALFGGEVFDIEIDGVLQSYTFLAGDFFTPGSALPSEVATAINREFKGIVAGTVGAGLRVKITTNKMNGGSLKVLSSTSNAILLFPETQVDNLIAHLSAVESGLAEPYSFVAGDTLIVILDGNLANNFTIPCSHSGTLTGAAGVSSVADTSLSTTFPVDTDLPGYEIEMTSGAQTGERKIISTYTAGTGVITTTTPFSGTPLAGDTYEILPADADQVVRLWNNTLVTTVSTVAEISASNSGTNVQISSLTPGRDGSVLVSGGSGNAVLAFPTTTVAGVDGYRHFTGLAEVVQKEVDGEIRAAGTQVEVIEPIKIPITVEVDVTSESGITLLAITNEVKTAISNYINTLPVGGDVIATEVLCAVKDVTGVADVTLISLEPRGVSDRNVPVGDSQLARINESTIIVG